MRAVPRSRLRSAGLLGLALISLGASTMWPARALASSHREAPFVSKNPKVDGSDFYMFRSYEAGRAGYITLLANYLPLQRPEGGPSLNALDPEALYEIHIDNTGDGVEDVTFQFRFSNPLTDATGEIGITFPIGPPGQKKDMSIPLMLAGGLDEANQFEARRRNMRETYRSWIVRGGRRSEDSAELVKLRGLGGTTFIKPIDYVGQKSLGDRVTYDDYARAHIFDVSIPGCTPPPNTSPRVFVGQRLESFSANVGNLFDLLNLDEAALTNTSSQSQSPIANSNVTTLALEVPTSCVRGTPDVIGAWTTASVPQARVINPEPSYAKPTREGGAWAQVSRVGSPLVNELLIGLKDKDRFNSSEPKDDARFLDYVTHPVLPALLEALVGPTLAAPTAFPRSDLVGLFLSGLPGLTRIGNTPASAEMLRLNVTLQTASQTIQYRAGTGPFAAGLGALACFKPGVNPITDPRVVDISPAVCDTAGYPNGRRPGDDVVDIVLRMMMGYLLPRNVAPAGALPLGDQVGQYDTQFAVNVRARFPYLATPAPGFIVN